MKKIKIIVLISAIIILGAGFFAYNAFQDKIFVEENQTTENSQKEAFLRIDFGDGTFKDFSADFDENYSAFDLLEDASEQLAIPIKTKTYDIGVLVEAVGGIEGGKDNKYWMYYVNGELPMVSADKNYLKAGDKVEFKFEESKF